MLGYFTEAHRVLTDIEATQQEAIQEGARRIGGSLLGGGVWHVFGTGHSHVLGEEVFYRAGGLAPVNAILFPALMQHEGPVTSTRLERLPGLARVVFEKEDIRAGEVLTIVSNSGKNAVPVEMALIARERGVQTVAITSLQQSRAASYGAGLTQKLYDVCDVVIDNCCPPGDAALPLPGLALETSALSTLAGVAIMEQIVHEVACAFLAAGQEPPVFKTANLPGGDAWNAGLIARYRGRVKLV